MEIKDLNILEPLSADELNQVVGGSQIVIGSTYTQAMGLKEGDKFEIKLGYKYIHLKQLDEDDNVNEEN